MSSLSGGYDVGSIYATVGARFVDRGFDMFDRAVAGARRSAARPVEAELKADVDSSGFRKYDQAVDSADRSAKRAERSNSRLVGVVGKSGTAFRAVGTGAAAGAVGVGLLGKTFVATQVDIEESLTKNEQLFGRHAKGIDQWSTTTARAFGISRRDALAAAGSYGSLFETIGLGDKAAAQMSTRFSELAGDLASFNNATPQEALDALKSGLIGEAEPMRRFGALLSETRVQAEAWKSGIAEQGAELTEQQKVQARYNLILKDTRAAQGDFGRTSGGLANQLRILKAQFSDAGAQLGSKLLPVAIKATTFLNDLFTGKGVGDGGGLASKVRGAVSGVVDFFRPIGDEVRDWGRSVMRVYASIGRAFDDVFGGGSGIGRDLGKIVRAMRDFGGWVLKVASTIMDRALPGIEKAFRGLFTVIRGVVRLIAGVLTGDFGKAWDGVKDIFGGAITTVLGVLRAATAPFREVAARVGGGIAKGFSAAWEAIEEGLEGALDFMLGGLTQMLGAVSSVLSTVGNIPGVGGPFKDAAEDIDKARDSIDGYREALRKTDKEQKRSTAVREARADVRLYRDILEKTAKGSEGYRQTAQKLERAQQRLNRATGQSKPASDRAAKGFGTMARSAHSLGWAVGEVGEYVVNETNAVLQEFGAKRIEHSVKKFRANQRGPGFSTNARGGMYQFGMPGEAGPDSLFGSIGGFNVAVAPGEVAAVLTRHHQAALNAILAPAGGLGGFLKALDRPHSAPRFARGGIVPIPWAPGEEINASVLPLATQLHRRFGSTISDAFDRDRSAGHVSPGHNVTGTAADWVGGNLLGLVKWTVRHGIKTLYNTPPGTYWPGHDTHAHTELGGKGSLEALRRVARVIVKGGTRTTRGIAQGTADRLVQAANAYTQRRAAAIGATAGPVSGAGFAGGGTAAQNRLLGQRMARPRGWGRGAQWAALDHLWGVDESGWRTTADNPTSDAYGIPQALPGSKMATHGADWATNPATQIAWGLDYIRDRYGDPLRAHAFRHSMGWYQKGGLVGKGGTLTRRGRRARGRWVRTLNTLEDDIGASGTQYELLSRRYDLSEEELINEGDENTPPSFNMSAIARRWRELQALMSKRAEQARLYRKTVVYLGRVERLYQTMVRRLGRVVGRLRGRIGKLGDSREDKRSRRALEPRLEKWAGRLRDARENLETASDERRDAGFDLSSTRLDIKDLRSEAHPLGATLMGDAGVHIPGGLELPEWEAPEGLGGSGDADSAAVADQARAREQIALTRLSDVTAALRAFVGSGDLGQGGRTARDAVLRPGQTPVGPGYVVGDDGRVYPTGGAAAPSAVFADRAPQVQQNIYTLHPGDPATLDAVGRAATAGISLQGSRVPPRESADV